MATFYMLCGVAGCGKSTWAENNKTYFDFDVLSSDEYRKLYLKDVNDQNHNSDIFEMLRKDAKKLLQKGVNVCIDATNLTLKSRSAFLTDLKNVDCYKCCILFAVDPYTIKKQNKSRERQVPEEVIDKMIASFEVPLYSEGFDEIATIYSYDTLRSWDTEYIRMKGIDQCNPHHTLTLQEHCDKCAEHVAELEDEQGINDYSLVLAAKIHDIGKLYTRTWDEVNQLAHYYRHENVGAYMSLLFTYPPEVDSLMVARYINYHMKPYILKNSKPSTIEKYTKLLGDVWNQIYLLNEADDYAH